MNASESSLSYITLLFGMTRLLVAFYAFILVGIKRQRAVHLPFQVYQRAFVFFLGFWELTRAIYYLYPGTYLLPRFASLIYIAVPFSGLTYFYFCFSNSPKNIGFVVFLSEIFTKFVEI